MLELVPESGAVALVGLVGGILLGLAARIGRFCTLGAIEDFYYGGSTVRLRMWGVALGLAIIGSFCLMQFDLLDPSQTLYLSQAWVPAASIFGGLLFGYGMALSGNCGYGALARLGGGDLRAFVIVLVMGLTAYGTLNGPMAGLRVKLFTAPHPPASSPDIPTLASNVVGLPPLVTGLAVGVLILSFALASRDFLRKPASVFWGVIVGLAIVSGWAGTQWVADHGFEATPVLSHSFSAPLGETLLYLMTSSGNQVSFGVGSVLGVLVGAFAGSLYKGHFRWEACEDHRELRRQILGAALMGVGAVVAVGCSVGQGLSAFSVLAFSGPVTFLAILAGASIGLRQLIVGFSRTV